MSTALHVTHTKFLSEKNSFLQLCWQLGPSQSLSRTKKKKQIVSLHAKQLFINTNDTGQHYFLLFKLEVQIKTFPCGPIGHQRVPVRGYPGTTSGRSDWPLAESRPPRAPPGAPTPGPQVLASPTCFGKFYIMLSFWFKHHTNWTPF